MSFLATEASVLEADWTIAEEVVETDVLVIWTTIKPLLSALAPSQAAVLIGVVKDNLVALVMDPEVGMTAALADLAAKELAWWDATEATLQNALIRGFSAALALTRTTVATVVSADTASSSDSATSVDTASTTDAASAS